MKKRITFSLLLATITFIVLYALLCPHLKFEVFKPNGNPFLKANANDGKVLTAGTVTDDGIITVVDGDKCAVQYDLPNGATAKTLLVDFKDSSSATSSLIIERTADNSFTDLSAIGISNLQNESFICTTLKDDITSVRIWFMEDCSVKSINFYDTQANRTELFYPIETWRYVVAVVGTILAFIIFFLIDTRFLISNRLISFFKQKKVRLLKFSVGCLCSLLIALIFELVLRLIIGPDSAGQNFSMASFGIFALVLLTVFIFIFEQKSLSTKPERIVAFIILTVGLFIIFTEPFSHNSSDEDSHYFWAVNNSFVGKALLSNADDAVRLTDGFFLEDAHFITASLEKVSRMNSLDQTISRVADVKFSIPHIPAGVFIAVARLFGADFRTKFIFGQLPMLFIYTALCYFSIKKIKLGKMILAVISLFPTSVLLSCNFSYDPWLTGFAMLGTAYFINELEQPDKPMKICDTVVMCGAFLLASLPKQIYASLFVLPFFLIKSYKSKKQRTIYYLIVAAFFTVAFLSFAMRSTSSLGGSGDVRGGAVNPGEQLAFVLNNPFQYIKSLIKLFLNYFSPLNSNKYITFFSYLGQGKGEGVFLAALLFCAATDKSSENRFKGMHIIKILALLVMLGTITLVATAMYLSFTPVGHDTINGCQPRYLIPLLAPVMLTVFNPGITKLRNFKAYNFLILSTVTLTLLLNTIFVITVPML